MRRGLLLVSSFALLWLSALAAIKTDRFTATWDLPTTPVDRYEFRWKHFASNGWLPLPDQPGTATTFTATFRAVPNDPATDRWMCVDARAIVAGVPGPWLSETATGPSCNVFEAGLVVVPTPPAPLPPPPPAPVPPIPPPDIFTNLQQADGRLSLDYQVGACPRGVQKITGSVKNGSRTITLICRR